MTKGKSIPLASSIATSFATDGSEMRGKGGGANSYTFAADAQSCTRDRCLTLEIKNASLLRKQADSLVSGGLFFSPGASASVKVKKEASQSQDYFSQRS